MYLWIVDCQIWSGRDFLCLPAPFQQLSARNTDPFGSPERPIDQTKWLERPTTNGTRLERPSTNGQSLVVGLRQRYAMWSVIGKCSNHKKHRISICFCGTENTHLTNKKKQRRSKRFLLLHRDGPEIFVHRIKRFPLDSHVSRIFKVVQLHHVLAIYIPRSACTHFFYLQNQEGPSNKFSKTRVFRIFINPSMFLMEKYGYPKTINHFWLRWPTHNGCSPSWPSGSPSSKWCQLDSWVFVNMHLDRPNSFDSVGSRTGFQEIFHCEFWDFHISPQKCKVSPTLGIQAPPENGMEPKVIEHHKHYLRIWLDA